MREKILITAAIGMLLGGTVVSQSGAFSGINMQNNPIYNLNVGDDPEPDQAASVAYVDENGGGGGETVSIPVGGPQGSDGSNDAVVIPTGPP